MGTPLSAPARGEVWPVTAPLRECDVVMKGGIASGVVYAGAILELAREFRFRSIGGTSAGAIGAAVAAAAEFRRQRGGPPGFAGLLQPLVRDLATPGFFPSLLKATPAARPLVRIMMAAVAPDHGRLWRTLAVLVWSLVSRWWLTLGAVAGAALLIWGVLRQDVGTVLTAALIGVVVMLAAIVAIGGAALLLVRAAKRSIEEPRNRMGLCSGMGTETAGPGVTDWLYKTLQDVAELPSHRPLTFGQLADESIELAMITTDLAAARPVRFPLAVGSEAAYWYNPADMQALFPKEVCDHLEGLRPHEDEQGLRPLPVKELPVIVALRMSLSLPLLLAAVPLFRADEPNGRPTRERRTWFADGGITSNFPIQLFDAWLPLRPTFGLDLRPQTPPSECRVNLPRPEDPSPLRWENVATAFGLLRQVADAAQNWRDTAQAELPGYRDRVCQVRLRSGEGGIHLDMAATTASELMDAGRSAGRKLADAFDAEGLARHQGRRYVILMRLLQARLEGLEQAFARVDRSPLGLLVPNHPDYGGQFLRRARRATESLLVAAKRWRRPPHDVDFNRGIEATPPPHMRVGPDL
jgi:predicted acylesterase/phospholipase RssA